MHLAKLLLHVPGLQDQVDVVQVDSGYGPGYTDRTNLNPANHALIANNQYDKNQIAVANAFGKRDFLTELDIPTEGIEEIELVLLDESAFDHDGIRGALYAYDVSIQFVYEEVYEMTYEEKAAEFERQKTAIQTLQ